jgi:putative oxidoreductase
MEIFARSSTPTNVNLALLAMRVIVGSIFAVHGAQKVLGVYGGPGLAGIVGLLGPVGYLVAIGEFLGGLGIIAGFLTRFSAAANIVIMLGAIFMVHGKNGFLLSNAGGGYEYNLALIGLMVPLVLLGPGQWAVASILPLPKSRRTGRPLPVLE